jgi:FAD/FMN-containing dehydrogenase
MVFESVSHFKGSISAEHGVGSMKVDKLPHYKDPVALAMMRSIKQSLDPHNIMNPGRVISR